MLYLLMFVYMILLPITLIAFLWKILDKLERFDKRKETEPRALRKHPSIEKSNYDNVFGGRKAYEVYKNKQGLYEPVTPSRGVKIEKKEE